MADEAASQPQSIRDRIAALKLNQVGQIPTSPPPSYDQAVAHKKARPPPPPLPKRSAEQRSSSTNNPPLLTNGVSSTKTIRNQPAAVYKAELLPPPALHRKGEEDVSQRPNLPPRPSQRSTPQVPSLPPRRPSEPQIGRRGSIESIASTVSARSTASALSSRTATSESTGSRVRAPPYDPATLPPLPERKNKAEPNKPRAILRPARSTTNIRPIAERKTSPAPPPLPGRPALPSRTTAPKDDTPNPAGRPRPPLPSRSTAPRDDAPMPVPPRRSALDFSMNRATETPPPLPNLRPTDSSPPPVPVSSRPDLAALQASKPKSSAPSNNNVCLKCRDFSAPDAHAARFPRESLPSQDINWLAQNLTSPFPSATDKARVLFTWLHHNIAYDVDAFFSNNVKPSTPGKTLATGLAVCEGYAGLFAALGMAAGLEVLVVGGHGKGFGIQPLKPGEPVPPVSSNHAWNVVRIDNGEWKLIESTWGSGGIGGPGQPYTKRFSPDHFTMTNEEFGVRHFPSDRTSFYRADGRTMTWEEYMLEDAGEERRMVYGNVLEEHGIDPNSIKPLLKKVKLNDPAAAGPTVRFQMEKYCRHWDNAKHGKGPDSLFLLEVHGRDGRNKDMIPFEHDGYFWWVDVARVEVGAPGQKARIVAITMFDGKDGRGLTKQQYLAKKGRVAYGMGFLADWDLSY